MLEICCRKAKNPNRNHSNVVWDCYYRRCTDDPSLASSAVAVADEACIGEQQHEKQSCLSTREAVSHDYKQQVDAHARCGGP